MKVSIRTATLICCLTWLLAGRQGSSICAELETADAIQLAGSTMHVSWRPAHVTRSPDLLIHFFRLLLRFT